MSPDTIFATIRRYLWSLAGWLILLAFYITLLNLHLTAGLVLVALVALAQIIRVHARHWGTYTAAPLLQASLAYFAVLFLFYLVSLVALTLPLMTALGWVTLLYILRVLYLDAKSVGRAPLRPQPPRRTRGPDLSRHLR